MRSHGIFEFHLATSFLYSFVCHVSSATKVCSLHFSTSDIKLPRSVYDRLYHYQRQGVVWMWNLYHKGDGLTAS